LDENISRIENLVCGIFTQNFFLPAMILIDNLAEIPLCCIMKSVVIAKLKHVAKEGKFFDLIDLKIMKRA
jgi:hypothetical protein